MTDAAAGTEYLSLEDLLDLVKSIGPAPSGIWACSIQPATARRLAFSARRHIRRWPERQPRSCTRWLATTRCSTATSGSPWATVVFLRINGYVLDLTDDEAFDLTMSVAAGQLDADGIQERLRLAPAPP